ncbi:hypothetical protein BC936DRAFT_145142, partial [Jimgerdemannia flammicorona]
QAHHLLTYRRWIVKALSRYGASCRYHKSARKRGPSTSPKESILCPLRSRKSLNGAWVANTLDITFAAAEHGMRLHAVFLCYQMKQVTELPESSGLSPLWTWLRGQRRQMPGVTNGPSTNDAGPSAPGQSTSARDPSSDRKIGGPKLSSSGSGSNMTAASVSTQKNADLAKVGTLDLWLLSKQTQASTSAVPGTPSAPSLTRKDAAASAATAVEVTINNAAKQTKQATAISSRKPETQPSTKENKPQSTSARKKPSARMETETEVEPEAGPSRKPPSKSSRSVRSVISSRKRSRSTEAITSGIEHVVLDPESAGSSTRRPIKATRKTLMPKIKSLYEDAAKNMHIVEFPTYKYPENGIWYCWLSDCKKQINVANYDENEDLVEAAVAEHIEEHYNAIWNKWTQARRDNYEQLVRKSETRVRRWIDENEDMRKERLLMDMAIDGNFMDDDAMRVEKPPIQWPSFGSAMSGVKPSKDTSNTMHRPLLHILDGGGASEKERLFRLSKNVANRRSPIPIPIRMARAQAPTPAPDVPPEVLVKVSAKVSDKVPVTAAPIPPRPAVISYSVPDLNPAPAQPSIIVPDPVDIIVIDDDDDGDDSVDVVKFVEATRKKKTDAVIHDSKLEDVKSEEKEKVTTLAKVVVLDYDDEDKIKSSVPVPSAYALSSSKSLVQSDTTVGKSSSPSPRKDSTMIAAKIKDSPLVMAGTTKVKDDTRLKGSAVSVGRGSGSSPTAVPKPMTHHFVNLDSEDEELMGSPSKKTKLDSGKGIQVFTKVSTVARTGLLSSPKRSGIVTASGILSKVGGADKTAIVSNDSAHLKTDQTLSKEIVKETVTNVALIQDLIVHDSRNVLKPTLAKSSPTHGERSPPNLYDTTVLPGDEPGIGVSSLWPLKPSNEWGGLEQRELGYDVERAPAGLASDRRGTLEVPPAVVSDVGSVAVTTKSVGNLFTASSHNMLIDPTFAHSTPTRPLSIGIAPTGIPTPKPPFEGVLPPVLPLLTPRLQPILEPSVSPAQWTCTSCTFVHTGKTGLSYTKCDVCDSPRIWPCAICTYIHHFEVARCVMCGNAIETATTWDVVSYVADDVDKADNADNAVASHIGYVTRICRTSRYHQPITPREQSANANFPLHPAITQYSSIINNLMKQL